MLPANDRIEYSVSNIGAEHEPTGILLKGTVFTIYSYFGKLYLSNYDNSTSYLLMASPSKYRSSLALDVNLIPRTDIFWFFAIINANLVLYEVEPFVSSAPLLTGPYLLETNAVNFDINVVVTKVLRVVSLSTSADLKVSTFRNPILGSNYAELLSWATDRVSNDLGYMSDTPGTNQVIVGTKRF